MSMYLPPHSPKHLSSISLLTLLVPYLMDHTHAKKSFICQGPFLIVSLFIHSNTACLGNSSFLQICILGRSLKRIRFLMTLWWSLEVDIWGILKNCINSDSVMRSLNKPFSDEVVISVLLTSFICLLLNSIFIQIFQTQKTINVVWYI